MADCLTALTVRGQQVPCGKCPNCRKRKQSEWSFRLMQHDRFASNAIFVTLTYAPENVPVSENGFMTLRKRDVQLFMKRLRKASPKLPKIKYYFCGEYGGNTLRPHYHAIMFNVSPQLVVDSWGLGHCHVGTVTGASVGYTLKYISKKGKIPMHQRDDRVREFSMISQGIGLGYLTDGVRAWYRAAPADRMYAPLEGGKKAPLARYYKLKLFPDDGERKRIAGEVRAKVLAQRERVALTPADYDARFEGVAAAFRAAEAHSGKGDVL